MGIRWYIATNQEKRRVEYMKSKMDFDKLFDQLFVSFHFGYMKPNINFFVKIMDDLKCINKKEVLFWDNFREHVEAAKLFGINAELYVSYKDFSEKIKIAGLLQDRKSLCVSLTKPLVFYFFSSSGIWRASTKIRQLPPSSFSTTHSSCSPCPTP